jgi:uncharacterized protein (DUF362 family)
MEFRRMLMKSTVSISYSEHIEEAINSALKLIPDLNSLLKDRHVAIKPNETWASEKDLTPCTQADTVRSVIRFVKKHNPRKITVTGGAGAAETGNVFRILGIDKVISDEEVEYFDHNRPPFTAVELRHGPQREVMVNPQVLKNETLISLAQHKVHNSATVTLTMKNIALSYPAADYYGHPREKKMRHHEIFSDLQAFIAAMCQRFRIDIGIVVGHPVMVGRGPIGGKTFESGLVIAGTDCVSVDSVGAMLLGFSYIGHIAQAEDLGVGTSSLEDIVFPGLSFNKAMQIFRRKEAEAGITAHAR